MRDSATVTYITTLTDHCLKQNNLAVNTNCEAQAIQTPTS